MSLVYYRLDWSMIFHEGCNGRSYYSRYRDNDKNIIIDRRVELNNINMNANYMNNSPLWPHFWHPCPSQEFVEVQTSLGDQLHGAHPSLLQQPSHPK